MTSTTTAWRSVSLRDCKASVADMVLTVDPNGFVVDTALTPAAVAKLRGSPAWSEAAVKAPLAAVEAPQASPPTITPAPVVESAPMVAEPKTAAPAKADAEPQPSTATAEPRKGNRKWR